jgi:hypothetical protein
MLVLKTAEYVQTRIALAAQVEQIEARGTK